MHEGLAVLGFLFVYAFIGTVFAGIITRATRGDSSLVPPCVIVWPILMPIFSLIFVYAVIIRKPFYLVVK